MNNIELKGNTVSQFSLFFMIVNMFIKISFYKCHFVVLKYTKIHIYYMLISALSTNSKRNVIKFIKLKSIKSI